MNYSIIFKLLSIIFATIALAFGAALGVSMVYAENAFEAGAYESWVASVAIAAVFSLIFYLPSRNSPKKIFRREALCVVGLGWILCSILGAIPYALILNCGFADAFFESVSGFTSTGASVFADVESFPKSILFWRALTQWIGGLGVVVFFVALLSSLGTGAKTLYGRESGSSDASMIDGERMQMKVLKIILLYFCLSALCCGAYFAAGMPIFDAICHMMATVSTGGFSVKNDSFASYGALSISWIAILFMFLGGTNFAVILMILGRKFREAFRNSELKTYVLIVSALSLGIFLSIAKFEAFAPREIFRSLTNSVFMVVSIITSTGFVNADYQKWLPVTHVLIFFMFVVGGSSGSTSGGIKIYRALAVLKIGLNNIEKSFRTNVVRLVRMNGRAMSDSQARDILSYIALYVVIATLATVLLAAFEPNLSFGGCISTAVSAISNMGPGLNETSPAQTYAFFNPSSKFLLSIIMIMGRLEFYAILALFMPSLWRSFK
ncbi:MAG: TrkH family potassium uptake protein [Opitutales bacterium]|nr:TrkH family potassium uptake protein [Opitutales bacterium]